MDPGWCKTRSHTSPMSVQLLRQPRASGQISPADGVGELPLDFLTHLQQRLGIGREASLKMLGEWLLSYEPRARTAGVSPPYS
jgi:hypothetical protein